VADRLSRTLTELETTVRQGRPFLGERLVRVDAYRIGGLLDFLLMEFTVEAKAVRWAEQRRVTDGDPPLGPLPAWEDVTDAREVLRRFVEKRRSDVASFGGGTLMSRPRLEALLARLLEVATPWARQFRDYASFFPEELDEDKLFQGLPASQV
jgi:hypothetical protein